MHAQGGEGVPDAEARRKVKGILNRANECFQLALRTLQGERREWAYQELDRVITDCGEAIRIDPDHSEAYQLRARAFEHKGEDDKAEADMRRVREIHLKKR
jgi:Tfp pilus assembly protein PilF